MLLVMAAMAMGAIGKHTAGQVGQDAPAEGGMLGTLGSLFGGQAPSQPWDA